MAVEVHSTIVPKNNGSFFVVNAENIGFKGFPLSDYMPVEMSQEAYDALKAAGKDNPRTPYIITGV